MNVKSGICLGMVYNIAKNYHARDKNASLETFVNQQQKANENGAPAEAVAFQAVYCATGIYYPDADAFQRETMASLKA